METWLTGLTPLSFLERSAAVFPDKTAVVYGSSRLTYRELSDAVQQRARALRAAGVQPGDRVAYLMPNIPEMLIATFAVPLAGAVLVAVNTRLAPEEVRYICDHSQARVLVVDSVLAVPLVPVAAQLATVESIIIAADPEGPPAQATIPNAVMLSELLAGVTAGQVVDAAVDEAELAWAVADEHATISINYTSGTTGRPKGVMYTHRGAYLNALGEVFHSCFDEYSVYLWTLPMFHCNGWCTAWALAAAGGTQVCLRDVRGDTVWQLLDSHGVTHLNGAPTVVTAIMNAEQAHPLDRPLLVTTAGAPPSPTMIQQAERMGLRLVHVYGLTETYGPYSVCQWQEPWDAADQETRARLQARQGVGMIQAERLRVVRTDAEPDDGSGELVDVPADGVTMGEIVMRGNNVMKGYFRDEEATAAAFAGGWFHSGDLGVMHPDGYVELRDRAKDVVISGGENISTVEVEQAVVSHPSVLEAAVIGVPDDRWGERPKAFVILRPGHAATEAEILAHVRSQIAHYKAPREVEFVDALPKTSTGKIQKFELREKEWTGRERRIQG